MIALGRTFLYRVTGRCKALISRFTPISNIHLRII
ncbi:Uncharacterised protein [Vibrio cholerae]|nr:Uncharacterised protein [Vibrio cholerae]